jgi:hypothetical protein
VLWWPQLAFRAELKYLNPGSVPAFEVQQVEPANVTYQGCYIECASPQSHAPPQRSRCCLMAPLPRP